jgi:hypothetical protein
MNVFVGGEFADAIVCNTFTTARSMVFLYPSVFTGDPEEARAILLALEKLDEVSAFSDGLATALRAGGDMADQAVLSLYSAAVQAALTKVQIGTSTGDTDASSDTRAVAREVGSRASSVPWAKSVDLSRVVVVDPTCVGLANGELWVRPYLARDGEPTTWLCSLYSVEPGSMQRLEDVAATTSASRFGLAPTSPTSFAQLTGVSFWKYVDVIGGLISVAFDATFDAAGFPPPQAEMRVAAPVPGLYMMRATSGGFADQLEYSGLKADRTEEGKRLWLQWQAALSLNIVRMALDAAAIFVSFDASDVTSVIADVLVGVVRTTMAAAAEGAFQDKTALAQFVNTSVKAAVTTLARELAKLGAKTATSSTLGTYVKFISVIGEALNIVSKVGEVGHIVYTLVSKDTPLETMVIVVDESCLFDKSVPSRVIAAWSAVDSCTSSNQLESRYCLSGGSTYPAWSSWSSSSGSAASYTSLSPGSYTFSLEVRDAKGNVGHVAREIQILTVRPPSVTVERLGPESRYDISVHAKVSPCSECCTPVEIRINSGEGSWGSGWQTPDADGVAPGLTFEYSKPGTYYVSATARCVNAHEFSATSEGIAVTIGQTELPPPPPSPVSATDGTYTDKVRVSWGAVSGATSYYVYRGSSASGAYSQINQGTATAQTYYDDRTASASGTHYWYRVRAYKGGQYSSVSAPDEGWRGTGTPPPPPGGAVQFYVADRFWYSRGSSSWGLESHAGIRMEGDEIVTAKYPSGEGAFSSVTFFWGDGTQTTLRGGDSIDTPHERMRADSREFVGGTGVRLSGWHYYQVSVPGPVTVTVTVRVTAINGQSKDFVFVKTSPD